MEKVAFPGIYTSFIERSEKLSGAKLVDYF